MKTILSILFVALGLPALAGNSEEALRKQLATIEKQINELRISQKALYGKRSAVLKQLHAAKIAASRKPTPAKGKPNKPSTRKPSPKKKPAATKPGVKKPSTKKPSSDVAKKAAESRARFLQRFDTNRDGKVAKEEAKAVLAAEAKKRAASRKKPAKPSVKKTSTKKPSSDVAKRATESRAKFLQRFDANRDGKVTKEETKAVLAAEAKKRAAAREKKKR